MIIASQFQSLSHRSPGLQRQNRSFDAQLAVAPVLLETVRRQNSLSANELRTGQSSGGLFSRKPAGAAPPGGVSMARAGSGDEGAPPSRQRPFN